MGFFGGRARGRVLEGDIAVARAGLERGEDGFLWGEWGRAVLDDIRVARCGLERGPRGGDA